MLEHTTLTKFCGIPLDSLRKDSLTELDLSNDGFNVPGAIVLSSLLPSAVALKKLKYAA